MHNHLPKHGIWGKPVLTHGDLHGENMLQPDDPNVPIKIIGILGNGMKWL